MDLIDNKATEIVYPSLDEIINPWQLVLYANQLIREDPDCVGAWILLTKLYILRREYVAAISSCRRALELSPNSANLHSKLAVLLFRTEYMVEAGEHFKKAMHLEPESAKFVIDYAEFLLTFGRMDEALFYCQIAVALDPENIWYKNLFYSLQVR